MYRFLFLCALSWVALPGRLAGQQVLRDSVSGVIRGQLLLEWGIPDYVVGPGDAGLPGIDVALYDASNRLVGETKTQSDGTFRFDRLKDGRTYRLEIQPVATGLHDWTPGRAQHKPVYTEAPARIVLSWVKRSGQ
ncbi:MAG: hypothetical protein OHK0039_09220 [Bacteroidia bacterium]